MADPFSLALIAELAKKSGVSWVDTDGKQHPVWHLWLDGAMYVVSGGDEQRLPGIDDAATATVTLRSSEDGGRLVTWVADVSAVRPEDEAWPTVTGALIKERLNLGDPATAADTWAEQSLVSRLSPNGELLERPGHLSAESHATPPVPTPATTRGRLPKALHRRVRRRPKLS